MDAVTSRCWIFQAHPGRYDVAQRLVAGRTDNWVVRSPASEIRPGDVVYLWRADSEDALYGWAVVNSEVFERKPARSRRSKAAEVPVSEVAPELRVELAYRVRFEPPITRTEIRLRPELAGLATLRTSSGTDFPVALDQAIALHRLVREHRLEAPPDPSPTPGGAPPRSPEPIRWERLSAPAHEVLGWAAASERPAGRVGTRGLLIGLVRLKSGKSEAVQLLEFVDRTPEELFDALQQVRPTPAIDPTVQEPDALTGVPPLTDNARHALELAFGLQGDPAGLVDVKHLFGALLGIEKSRAYEALGRILGGRAPIERVAQTYPEYMATGASAYRDFLEDALSPRDRAEWISDSVARDDLLKRRKLAEVVAIRLRRIRDLDPASFLIHVDGPWGSGKSTLLDFLADELKKDDGDNGAWVVVRYDAWRETRVGPPWWTMLVQLREELKSQVPNAWGRVGMWASEARHRFRSAGLLYLLVLALAVVLFIVIGPDEVAAYITAISALIAGALAVGRVFLWDSAQGARIYENVQTNPMESLSNHFAWLMRRSPRPVVFLIDELDRCTDTQVVDLLDAIQTLVRDAPRKLVPLRRGQESKAPYFVIAADGAWIRQSYELAHEKMAGAVAEPGRPLGHLFLAKIFQLTVRMPSLSPELQAGYLHSLLSGGPPAEETRAPDSATDAAQQLRRTNKEEQILKVLKDAPLEERQELATLALDRLNAPEMDRETERHVLDKFGALLEPNPRAIKRLIIAYGIERSVRTLEGNLVPRDTLVLWTILNTRWPRLGEYLTERPEGIQDIRSHNVPVGAPTELEPLFGAEAVSKVVEFSPGGPLTKELVAAAAGINLEQPRRSQSQSTLVTAGPNSARPS